MHTYIHSRVFSKNHFRTTVYHNFPRIPLSSKHFFSSSSWCYTCDNQLIMNIRPAIRQPLKLQRLRRKPRNFPDICNIDKPTLSRAGKNEEILFLESSLKKSKDQS